MTIYLVDIGVGYMLCSCLDEMHQFMTYMLYDLPFNCRVCCPSRPSVWEAFIKREMNEGMRNVLDDLVQSKLSFMLKRIKMVMTPKLLLILAITFYILIYLYLQNY